MFELIHTAEDVPKHSRDRPVRVVTVGLEGFGEGCEGEATLVLFFEDVVASEEA